MSTKNVTYAQLSSFVSPSFWSKLTEIKLNVDKLNETKRPIWGLFTNLNNAESNIPILEVDSTSFNSDLDNQRFHVPFQGKLLNNNTIEQFKQCDKGALLNSEGKLFLEKIGSDEAVQDPSILNFFFVFSFADLKKYHYYYWFAFPVLKGLTLQQNSCVPLPELFSQDRISQVYNDFQMLDTKQKAYFIIHESNNTLKVFTLKEKLKYITLENHNEFYFAFYNISNISNIPGSQLRNYATFIVHHCPFLQGKSQKFLAVHLNKTPLGISCGNSMVYDLILPQKSDIGDVWVGWEKNERDKMGPRMANMKNKLDPIRLAEEAVDLNLKLMKWRIMPNIDLDKIKNSKCLLLGTGTLGCSVARSLLAWGVRNITFVDNSIVSFSNPVRQSLFTYQDSVDSKPKSVAAAENLVKIFPGVNAKGHQLNIPMPGHPVGECFLKQTEEDVKLLIDLIKEHDIIFLLMDSRESRWLPTLLGNAYKKIVINTALGFDSYLIMRHGICDKITTNREDLNPPQGFKAIWGHNLGCYFCNDITAPGDSLKDRTLDQQCTVTRPGVSQIAGALAVELAVSLLQHPELANAPAFYKVGHGDMDSSQENQSILGLLPHSIRGFLTSFDHVLPATQKFKNCIACSEIVVDEYSKNSFNFLLKVFNSSKYLEEFTGLNEMFSAADDDVWALNDDQDDI